MLRRLTIRDFVIVDRLELEFEAGFGALTGETGAGKSILLDALGLVLGGRTDSSVVRSGRERADLSAEFDLPAEGGLEAWLLAQDLPLEEGRVLLRRIVEAGGRTRAWINGIPVTLTQLREAGESLADIHGQHAHYALMRPDAQRMLLDARAGAGALAAEVAKKYREWLRLVELRDAAEQDSAASVRERELLSWQIRELDEVAFEPTDWEQLNADHSRLAHAAGLIEGADEVIGALGENDLSAISLLQRIQTRVEGMAELDAELGEISALLNEAVIQADEALHTLRRYRDRLDLDPERLAVIERRIEVITDTARKYRVVPEDLPELRQRWQLSLESLEARSDPAKLAEQESQARLAYEQAARELSAVRVPAADALSREISASMQTLAMSGGRFEAALVALPQGGASGFETVEFRVAVNPNQPLRPMNKVASGGELSRIGLAIQVLTSRDAATPTLIFDEVDVGIGGRVAEIVGHLLRRLGRERQVLCVTHLPQVAACANWQWNIAKVRHGEDLLSEVAVLDSQGRIEEIARMLGGVSITETTRRHAAEMLAAATDEGK